MLTFTFPLCEHMRPTKTAKIDGIGMFLYKKGTGGLWVGRVKQILPATSSTRILHFVS